MKQTLLRRAFCYALLLTLVVCASARGQVTPATELGSAAHYGLLSATTITAQSAPIQVLGKAGAGESISASVAATAGRFAQGSGTVPQALADLQQAQHQCASLGGQAIAQLSGTLTGGAYTLSGAASLGSGNTLTIAGDANTVVIINVAGDLTL